MKWILCCLALVTLSLQGAPLPVQTHLILAPKAGNPRNSEGDFIRLKDGRIWFVYTHFQTGGDDHAAAVLMARESLDEGRTWSSLDRPILSNEGGMNVMSVSMLRLQSGQIALFYLRKNSFNDCRPVMRLSVDEGETWSEPYECIPDRLGYFVVNNNRVIQLKSGRLVVPAALHEYDGRRLAPGKIVVFTSDDLGKTWQESVTQLTHNEKGEIANFMEPAVIETSNQHLYMLIRTELGCQYSSRSEDGGRTWVQAQPTELLGPIAPASLVKLSKEGALLVIWNDHQARPLAERVKSPPNRNPLSIAVSKNAGQTWSKGQVLYEEQGYGYSYIATFLTKDNRLLLGFCAHPSPYGLETTRISSLSLDHVLK